MEKLQVVISLTDKHYLTMLLSFIRTTEYAEKFIVTSFSQLSSLEEWLIQSKRRVDILLADSELVPDESLLKQMGCIIYLNEFEPCRLVDGCSYLQKYQPLNQLLSSVVSLHNDRSGRGKPLFPDRSRPSRSKIVSVFSSVGGAGKTTLALNLCRQLAIFDYKACYVSLESFSSLPAIFGVQGHQDFSQLLYYLKTDIGQLQSKLELFRKHDPYMKFDYFEAADYSGELSEMTVKDAGSLLEKLVEMSCYDIIVIDLDSALHDRVIGAIQASSELMWLITEDFQCIHKTRSMVKELRRIPSMDQILKQRVKFVWNKCSDAAAEFDAGSEWVVKWRLPYVAEWKAVKQSERLFANLEYNERLMQLYNPLSNQAEESDIGIGGKDPFRS